MKLYQYMVRVFVFLYIIFGCLGLAMGQMKRERVKANIPVKAIFKAPNILLTNSVKNPYNNTLYMSIYHTFGPINSGVKEFFGLDVSANIRLGLDYGVNDRFSVGIGRTSYNKSIDGRVKYTLLYQRQNNNVPIHLSMAGDISINTRPHAYQEPYTFSDKLGYMFMIMTARKFSDNLSLQISPVYAHFNKVFEGEKNDTYGLIMAGRFKLTDHMAFAMEYIPQINKAKGNYNMFTVGVNIETGSHVFQLFISNTEYYNPQDILRYTRGNFWVGDIHFGFNVSRVFTFGAEGLHY